MPTPELDYIAMRALVYHDFGSQKFNARADTVILINDKNKREKGEAGKDFEITGMTKVLQDHFNTVSAPMYWPCTCRAC